MRIREAKKPEAERITRQLWLPLAREMEDKSEYNLLKEDLDLQQSIEHRRNGIREEGQYTFISEGDELLGFISATVKESPPIFQRKDKMKINELYVRPEARRRGIAKQLVDEVVEKADKEDCSTVELEVDTPNTEAKDFYRSQDFEVVRERFCRKLE